jgi:hypothetical protein
MTLGNMRDWPDFDGLFLVNPGRAAIRVGIGQGLI